MSTNKARQPEKKTRPVARVRRWGGRALLYFAFVVAILYSLFPPIAMAADTVGANIAALIAIVGGSPIGQIGRAHV